MKAIVLKEAGNVENLEYVELAEPTISEGEVLIKVKAISINPVDIKTRNGSGIYGRIKTESPLILGWDISGVVEDSQSPDFKKRDEVFGMVNFPGHGKAYAEYVTEKDVEEQYIASELLQLIRQEIDLLPPQCRQVMQLYLLERTFQ